MSKLNDPPEAGVPLTEEHSTGRDVIAPARTFPADAWSPSYVVAAALLFLLLLLTFGPALGFSYSADDYDLLHGFRQWSPRRLTYWRPLWTFWMSAMYEVFGLKPRPMHAVALGLHFLNCMLAFLALVRVGLTRAIALGAVALWAVMGGNAFAPVWVCSANDLLSLLLLLMATHFWISACRAPLFPRREVILAAAFWFVSMLAKEVAIAWPVAVAAFAWHLSRRRRHSTRLSGEMAAPDEEDGRRFAILVPLIALGILLALKVTVQGPSLGLDTHDSPYSETRGQPFRVVLIGKSIHFVEGLTYNFLPLDLFVSWPGLFAGVGISIAFGVALVVVGRRAPGSVLRCVAASLFWTLIFALHGSSVPEPRTMYIPTLGVATAISCLVFSCPGLFTKPGRSAVIFLGLFTAYVGMHIRLGQGVLQTFSPSGHMTLIVEAKLLTTGVSTDGHVLSADALVELRRQLAYSRVDELAREEPALFPQWRSFLKAIFRRNFKHQGQH